MNACCVQRYIRIFFKKKSAKNGSIVEKWLLQNDIFVLFFFESIDMTRNIRILSFERYITDRKLTRKKIWPKDVNPLEKGPKKCTHCSANEEQLFCNHTAGYKTEWWFFCQWHVLVSWAVDSFLMIMFLFMYRFHCSSFSFLSSFYSIRHFFLQSKIVNSFQTNRHVNILFLYIEFSFSEYGFHFIVHCNGHLFHRGKVSKNAWYSQPNIVT